ncbi:hypothetical protein ID866_1865 [Astraeus odoratus]|nr:hypothetical protein ID866_1865 [Astraeus odoratus]
MHRFIPSLIFLFLWSSLSAAQFGFFDHIFGNQQQQWQQRGPNPGNSQYNVHADSVSCSTYLCPDSLVCVSYPSECPCPYVEDIKCSIPDSEEGGAAATVICVRGAEGCSVVERLVRASYSR